MKYPGKDHLKYTYGSTFKGWIALGIIVSLTCLVIIACQKIVVITDSPGDHELEAPSPVHVDLERHEENTNTE